MEAADFAVRIEEVMAEEGISYECIFEDEEEIGRIWKFQIEDTIDGYVALEDNEETLGIQTVALGLYLRDITDYAREDLIGLFYANADFVNASFSVVKVPVPIESDVVPDLDEEEEIEPEFEEREILTIQSRIPADAFEPDDFKTYVENMLYQYQITMEAYEGEGEDEDEEDLNLLNELEELDDEE